MAEQQTSHAALTCKLGEISSEMHVHALAIKAFGEAQPKQFRTVVATGLVGVVTLLSQLLPYFVSHH